MAKKKGLEWKPILIGAVFIIVVGVLIQYVAVGLGWIGYLIDIAGGFIVATLLVGKADWVRNFIHGFAAGAIAAVVATIIIFVMLSSVLSFASEYGYGIDLSGYIVGAMISGIIIGGILAGVGACIPKAMKR